MVAEWSWHVLQFDLLNLRTVRQILLPRNSPESEEEVIHAPPRRTAAFKEVDLMFDPKMANGVSNKKESQQVCGFVFRLYSVQETPLEERVGWISTTAAEN